MKASRTALVLVVAALAGMMIVATCQKPDDVPPQMALVSPVEGETLQLGQVPIKVWAYDEGSGVDSVEFMIDQVTLAWVTTAQADTYRTTWNAGSVGQHRISAAAFDRKDNFNVRGANVYVRQ